VIANRIVTLGFGRSRGVTGRAGPITLGYGGPLTIYVTPESVVRRVHGSSSTKRQEQQLPELTIWAKLVSVNGNKIHKDVSGFVKVRLNDGHFRAIVEHVSTGKRKARDKVVIKVKRVK
jgi:hypothetical protein